MGQSLRESLSKTPLPVEAHRTFFLLQHRAVTLDVSAVYQGSPGDLVSRFLLEVGCIGTLCLAGTKIPDSQKESKYLV